MSELLNQITNLNTMSFEDARNIAGWVLICSAPAVASVVGVDYFRNPQTQREALQGADPASLEEASQVRQGRVRAQISRWGSYLMGGVAVSVASVGLLGPQLEYKEEVPGVKAIAILDESYSMQKATDMETGETRLDVMLSAIQDPSLYPDDLRLGVVSFGENVENPVVLTTDRQLLQEVTPKTLDDDCEFESADCERIDPNGGNLSGAIEAASNIMSSAETDQNGVFIIATDGTVDGLDRANQQIAALGENGNSVVILVPGTVGGTYKINDSDLVPTNSRADVTSFDLASKQNEVTVVSVTNSEQARDAIKQAVDAKTTKTIKRPTNMFMWIGGAIGAGAILRSFRRTWKRK